LLRGSYDGGCDGSTPRQSFILASYIDMSFARDLSRDQARPRGALSYLRQCCKCHTEKNPSSVTSALHKRRAKSLFLMRDETGGLSLESQMSEPDNEVSDKSAPRVMLNEERVLQIVPISRTTLFRMERAGRFPRSTYISPNRRVWFEDEIVAWQNAVDERNPNRGRGKGRRTRASAGAT
jgi:predicted DNA-binding transcriptional regulator AlpA